MARITNAALAQVVAEALDERQPLDTPRVMRVVTVEQVNDPFNDQCGQPYDDGYCRWLERNGLTVFVPLDEDDPYFERTRKLLDPLH